MRFVLASASPRRAELLRLILDDFEVIPSNIKELEEADFPDELVIENALAKARDIAEKHPDAIVLGFDTTVVHGVRLLGKPKDLEEAKSILTQLSGNSHDIVTGCAIVHRERDSELYSVEISSLSFNEIPTEEINVYVEHYQPLDRAAAYDVKDIPNEWVDNLVGSYANVRGLPVDEFQAFLHQYIAEMLGEYDKE